ncbi:MAG: DUF3429 domain-containing protein [Pararhodobacter sp.]
MTSSSPIPNAALWLGVAGLIPFVLGATLALAGTSMDAIFGNGSTGHAVPSDGPEILRHYGVIILAFMSGVLWGFSTRVQGREAATGYALSVVPALWAFFTTAGDTKVALLALLIGFLGLLALDWHFWRVRLAPAWWMRLRILLTSVVAPCLIAGWWA